jgi:hypothetical protein
MISAQTLRVCREGKPVSTFPDHALVLSIFRRQVVRSLVIEHAAKVTAINPSTARFAHEEVLGFMLVRISVLGNIYSTRDLHSSLQFVLSPMCVFTRLIEHPFDIPIESPQHIDVRALKVRDLLGHDQRLDRGLPRFKILFGVRKLHDVAATGFNCAIGYPSSGMC